MKGFICIVCFALAGLVWGRGDDMGNPGGLQENNIMFAYYQLEQSIDLTLNLDSVELDAQQRDVLTKILHALPSEYAVKKQIRFKRSHEHPTGFRGPDGHMRLAWTWGPLSQIWFNLDLLYRPVINNQYEIYALSQATSQLVHEFGHHHGIKDEGWLDALGGKVAQAVKAHVNNYPMSFKFSHIRISRMAYNLKGRRDEWDAILAQDGTHYIDLTRYIRRSPSTRFWCSSPNDTLNAQDSLVGVYLGNGYWRVSQRPWFQMESVLFCQEAKTKKIYYKIGPWVDVRPELYEDKTGILRVKQWKVHYSLCSSDPRGCRENIYQFLNTQEFMEER